MAVTMVVFENDTERTMMCADVNHNFDAQKKIFGVETEKLLNLCNDLFHVALYNNDKELESRLLGKIFGIAKAHGLHIKWYGHTSGGACEPDRFLVSNHGKSLAFIQC